MESPVFNNLEGLSQEQIASVIAELQLKLKQSTGNISAEVAPVPRETAKPRRRKQKKAVSYLTEEELGAFFRVIAAEGDVRDVALFELAYHRGLRASEVGMIQLAHLRMLAKRLYVTLLKGGTSGEFMLTEGELKALRAYLKHRGTKSGALFLSRNSKPISRRRLDELMKHYGTKAGLPIEKQHFHCLRHSCATSLLDRDVPIEEVQDHLGHTDIRNTMIYARVTNAKRKRKDERLAQEW